MHTRFTLFAALGATMLAAPIGAEPAKAPAEQTSQTANRPAELLLASANIRSPGETSGAQQGAVSDVSDVQTSASASAPAKRPRASRVTTCRCAGQTPQQP